MNRGKQLWYYLTAIAFPLFFILHGVNEQFGLISNLNIAELLVFYLVVAVGFAIISKFLFREYEHSTVFMFVLLCIFFFFGAAKDLIKGTRADALSHYSMFLPASIIVIVVSYLLLKRSGGSLKRVVLFIRSLLTICIFLETCIFIYNVFSHKERQKDFGDIDHKIIANINVPDSAKKPFIFWIVMDEYSGNTALKKRWHFDNPLDSVLRNKGFFSADSATSPYNYTHYSLASTLDMTYLQGLEEHSEIRFRDIVRGNISLQQTNVLKLLKTAGYDIHNYTIYDIDDHPTLAYRHFADADRSLLDYQTLTGRIMRDIGWKFDKTTRTDELRKEYAYRLSLVQEGLDAAKIAVDDKQPSFFMFHYMLTHEPFLYKADGSLDTSANYDVAPEKYVSSINYANNVISGLIDSIKELYSGKDLVIILQGDHGYKYDEKDSLFDQEGCSILYSVYCSDHLYPAWSNTFNSVNTFRVLFNKYFQANLPLLENHSYHLYYR